MKINVVVILIGIVLVLVGLFGFAYPVFTTSHNEEVAKLGSFKLQTQKETHHMIPPIVSGGFLGLGAFVIAAGVLTRR